MSDSIPYGRQWVTDQDIEAVAEVLRGDYLTTGPAVTRFEDRLREATGARHAVALNSGTSALHAMYAAAGLGPGDEIVTSPLTFAASANAALYLGATVKFADVRPDTGNISPEAVDAAIGPRTKLIVAVDYAGHPADYDALNDLAAARGVTLLADAAHSLGARYHGRAVGTLAAASMLSFHPVKPVTTAEGGAVVTDDEAIADYVARFRTHGVTRDPRRFHRDEGAWYYEQIDLGYNYRLSDVQAALGWSQLGRLADFIERRRQIAGRYCAELSDLEELQLPVVNPGVEPGWHLFVIRLPDAERRRRVFDRLRASGLGVQVHFIPVYWHPYYQALGFEAGLCPNAEAFYERAISLPIFPKMREEDADCVIERVTETVSQVL